MPTKNLKCFGAFGTIVSMNPRRSTVTNSRVSLAPRQDSSVGLDAANPYGIPAGRELDAYLHHTILKNGFSHDYPFYSTDATAAEALKRQLESRFAVKVKTGLSTIEGKPWFARYEREIGNPTEVIAETLPLTVCRLALLLARRI